MLTVEKIMQAHPKTVPPEMTLVNLERLFLTTRFTGFPVVQDGKLVGVVSRSDIVRSMVTERSRAEQLSDFYSGAQVLPNEDPDETLDAIAAQVGVRLAEQHVEDAMSHNIVSIESSEPVQRLASLMVEGHLHRIPVVNGDRLVGIATAMDLVRAISEGQLRESDEATSSQPLLT